jgi:hypothetical protein
MADEIMPCLPTLNARLLGKAILVLAVIDAALVGLGLILTPTTLTASRQGRLGVTAALAMLTVYGVLGIVGSRAVERRNPRILPIASLFGLVIGGLFVAEMLFEYAVLPSSKGNRQLAYLEFGGMFLFLLLAGFKGGQETGRLWHGVLTAIWSTMIGSLIWVASLLSTYCAFMGTARQEQVLAADQVLEDFKQSGMTDLRAFVQQDYVGGVFFHLLLGLIVAGILGMMGALVAKLLIWQRLVRSANT